MTLLFLYLIGQADAIVGLFIVLTIVFAFTALFGIVFGYLENDEPKKKFWGFAVLAVVFSTMAVAFPSKNTMILMAGGQAVMEVIHNPDVEKIAGSSAKIIENYLDHILNDQNKSKETR